MGKGSQPAACDAGLAPTGVLSTYAVEKFRGHVVGCQGNVRRCEVMSVGVCGIQGSGSVEHCQKGRPWGAYYMGGYTHASQKQEPHKFARIAKPYPQINSKPGSRPVP